MTIVTVTQPGFGNASSLFDPRPREGETMADQYCEHIHTRCREAGGRVFVADEGGAVAGLVAVLSHEAFTELDEQPGCYALVTDLVVLAPYRGVGIGRQLLHRAEAFAREAGATELRVGVLAENGGAKKLYLEVL